MQSERVEEASDAKDAPSTTPCPLRLYDWDTSDDNARLQKEYENARHIHELFSSGNQVTSFDAYNARSDNEMLSTKCVREGVAVENKSNFYSRVRLSREDDGDGISTTCVCQGFEYAIQSCYDPCFHKSKWDPRWDAADVQKELDKVIAIACSNYDTFFSLPPGTATEEMLKVSSAGITGWATVTLNPSIAPELPVKDNETLSIDWVLVEKDTKTSEE
eukprot:scaffold120431_cov56-Attheya_sp.AAC.1